MTLGLVGCEKWFSQQIEEGVFKNSAVASKTTFKEWVANQFKSYISILCNKSKDSELADLCFQLLIRIYFSEIDQKTKFIPKSVIIRTIARTLVDFENDKTEEIEKFSDFMSHPNFLFDLTYMMKEILDSNNDRNEILAKNVLFYFEMILQVFPNDHMDKYVFISRF